MQKSICIPGTPPVDISVLAPLIDHPAFQALRERRQLGVNCLVFPGAVHTRFEHAIGTLALTQRLSRIHRLDDDDARHLQAFALLHDLGHGPFSHQIEPVLHGDHHGNGIRLLETMQKQLADIKVDFQRLTAMFAGADPLAAWISDRNLGADKLDYLMRDALHIGFHGTPDIEKLQCYTLMTSEGIAIEEKFIEDAKQLQKFYSYLHQHGYLNKTALAAQRMLQRAVQEELAGRDGGELWPMSDARLLQWLEQARSPLSRRLARDLEARNLHRSFLVFKPTGYAFVERQADKPLAVMEWARADMRQIAERLQDTETLKNLENQLAAEFKLQPGDLLFAAMPYFKKLIPKDLRVFSQKSNGSFWLLENDADHRRSLESDYLRTFAVRLICPAKHRQALAAQANAIAETLRHAIQ